MLLTHYKNYFRDAFAEEAKGKCLTLTTLHEPEKGT